MAWVISPTVTVNGVSYTSNAVGGVSIDYGRSTVWEPQRAGYARIQLLNTNNTAFALDINQSVVVKVRNAANTADITVFTGVISNIENSVVLYSGSTNIASVTITAVAPLSIVARTQSGITAYPAETDNARISRILTECGVTIDTLDPAYYNYIARAANPANALVLANYYALMATGSLYETKDGKVGYDSQYSRSTDVSINGYFAIDPTYINFQNMKSSTSVGDLINSLILQYNGGVNQVTSSNATSQATYGNMAATIKTEIDNVTNAQDLSDLYVGMRAYPQTSLSSVEIRLDDPDINATTLDKMLNIYFGMPISIASAPVPLFNGTYYGFVEGWNLSFNQIAAKIVLRTSNKTYSFRSTIWSSVNPATQWSAVTSTTAWKDYD
jgi:hypothetical protein